VSRYLALTEPQLARALGVPAERVVIARSVLNAIAALPFPEAMREAMLVHLLDGPGLSVGAAYAAPLLATAPVVHVGALMEVPGIGKGRLRMIVQALGVHDPADYQLPPSAPEGTGVQKAAGSVSRSVVPLQTLAESAGEQLSATHRALQQHRLPVRLGDVQLTLKGELGQTDDALLGLSWEDIDPSKTSEVTVNYAVASAEEVASGSSQVPELRGYTLSLARRKAEAAGLHVVSRGLAVRDASQVGRVCRQTPAPGASLSWGQTVAVYMGRPIGAPAGG